MKFVDGNHWVCRDGGGTAGLGEWGWVGGDMKKLLPSFSFLMIFLISQREELGKANQETYRSGQAVEGVI